MKNILKKVAELVLVAGFVFLESLFYILIEGGDGTFYRFCIII